MAKATSNLALALGGGGARSVYEVGVLRCLARHFPDLEIPIITGVSAGAINAAVLANHTGGFAAGVEWMAAKWGELTINQVFCSRTLPMLRTALRWSMSLMSGGTRLMPTPRGVVDTQPLRKFLQGVYQTEDGMLQGVAENLRRGRLKAIGLTTISYGTGQSVTWVQGEKVATWDRPLRRSVEATLTVEHVMASCSLPIFFPAIRLDDSWHGDGGVRLTAPLSPALHLGAERILVISTRYEKSQTEADQPSTHGYPPTAAVIGVLLNSAFLDMLDYDAANMERLNKLVHEQPAAAMQMGLRPAEVYMLRPSEDLEMIASEYEPDLPQPFKFLSRGMGTHKTRSPDLLATLMFTPEYMRRVMEIGERDAEAHWEEIVAFLRGDPAKV